MYMHLYMCIAPGQLYPHTQPFHLGAKISSFPSLTLPYPLSLPFLLILASSSFSQDFMFRYAVLGREVGAQVTGEKERCTAILRRHDTGSKEWQIGKTKVSLVLTLL